MRLQDMCRQRRAEIGTRQRGDPRQPQRRRAELSEPALDQGADGGRGRQRGSARIGLRHDRAERFEDEVRIAPGMTGERARKCCRIDTFERQRIEQLAHVGFGQRRQRHFDQRFSGLGAPPSVQGHRHLGAAHGQGKAQPGREQRRQQFERGRIGEVKIIKGQTGQAGGVASSKRLNDRLAEARLIHQLRRRGAELRQHACELASQLTVECRGPAPARAPRATAAPTMRTDAFITGARTDQRNIAAARKVSQQPCLAHAGIGGQHGDTPLLPGILQRAPLTLAPDQYRRPAIAVGIRRAAVPGNSPERSISCASSRDSTLGAASSSLRSHCSQRVGGERRGAVAAPVVQPHQQPVRLFGQGSSATSRSASTRARAICPASSASAAAAASAARRCPWKRSRAARTQSSSSAQSS